MATLEKFNDLCRTCAIATFNGSRQHIFEGEGVLYNIPLKLKGLPIKVSQNDQLPKVMCDECVYKLGIVYEFIEKIKNTEAHLKDMLRCQATIIKVEPDICAYEQPDADNEHPLNACNSINIQGQETELKEEDTVVDTNCGTHFLDSQCVGKKSKSESSTNANQKVDQQNTTNISSSTPLPDQDVYIEHSSPKSVHISDCLNLTTSIDDLNQSPMFFLCRFCRLSFQSHDAANAHILQVHKKEQTDKNVDQMLPISEPQLDSASSVKPLQTTKISPKQCSTQTSDPQLPKPTGSKTDRRLRSKSDYTPPFYACTSCYVVYPTQEALTLHMQNHKPLPECKVCGVRFSTENLLVDHMTKDEHVFSPQENKVWKCSECGKECRKKCKIQNHIRVHTGERPFSCNFCPKAFPIKAQLTMHERKHKNDWCYICNYCGKGFYVKVYFDNHVRTTHTKEKPFKCDKCDACYASKASLKEHILSKHNDGSIPIRIYECKVCGKKFKDNNSLYYHNKTHAASLEERRKHKCLVCGASFVKNHYLRKHMKIHTGENIERFECHLCGKKLATSHGLELHLVIHSGVKNFICDFCGKAFASESTLKTHIRCHTGEKPYQCRVCSNYFTQRSSLLSHLKNIHNVDDRVRKIKFNN